MTINNTLLEKAIIFATKAHAGVCRKGDGRAYILHPLSVMNRVTELKKDEVSAEELLYLQIVAILHDVVEDEQLEGEDITIEIIESEFGSKIARGVAQLTLNKENYKSIGKKEYLIIEMNRMDDNIFDIKLCDRMDNVCDMDGMDEKDPTFKPYYIKQTFGILSKLVRDFKPSHLIMIKKIEDKLNSYSEMTEKEIEYIVNKLGIVYDSGHIATAGMMSNNPVVKNWLRKFVEVNFISSENNLIINKDATYN